MIALKLGILSRYRFNPDHRIEQKNGEKPIGPVLVTNSITVKGCNLRTIEQSQGVMATG